MRNALLFSFFAGLILAQKAQAQDPQFTQIYASPLYLNPAFTGNLEYDCRRLTASRYKVMMNYRSQYNADFNTLYTTIDYREKSGKLGLGAIILRDKSGSVPLTSTMLGVLGSYKVPIINDWQVHMGLQASFNYRNVNYQNFTFPDQFTPTGLTSSTNEPLANGAEATFVDFASGILLFNDKMYIGGAGHHLNQPNQSLYSAKERLPLKVSVHGGYKIVLKKGRGFGRARGPEKSITPTLHFKNQGNANQADIGTFFNYEPIILGVWYRGIPFLPAPDKQLNQEAAALMAGVKVPTDYGLIRLGFSYDFPLKTQVNSLGRTFELTLSYQMINEKCRKRIIYKRIPCPGL